MLSQPVSLPNTGSSVAFTDCDGTEIGAGDILLHGDMYWVVVRRGCELGLLHESGFEILQQYWCDCVRVVGSEGMLYVSS